MHDSMPSMSPTTQFSVLGIYSSVGVQAKRDKYQHMHVVVVFTVGLGINLDACMSETNRKQMFGQEEKKKSGEGPKKSKNFCWS